MLDLLFYFKYSRISFTVAGLNPDFTLLVVLGNGPDYLPECLDRFRTRKQMMVLLPIRQI